MPIEHGKETIVNPFFQAIQSANRAHCAALGLSAAELYGTEPNAAEIEVHDLIESGVPAEAAVPAFRPRKAKHLRFWPRTGVQELGYIEAFLQQCGCTPREHPMCHKAKAKGGAA